MMSLSEDGMLNRCKDYGVSDENVFVVNGEVFFNKLGVIQFFVGFVAFSEDVYDFNEAMRITVISLYDFCGSLADGRTFFSGELEGFKASRETLTCGELVNILYSIYENKSTVMGEYPDVKERLISLNVFIFQSGFKSYE